MESFALLRMGGAARLELLYFAAGDIAYGGLLHGYMAGSVFAGRAYVKGYGLRSCKGNLLLSHSREEKVWGELYYVSPHLVHRITASLGLVEEAAEAEHGKLKLPVVLHTVGQDTVCQAANGVREVRLLLALPPQTPPPAIPMASYPARLQGYEPCRNWRAYCPASGTGFSTALVDIVIHPRVLEEWLRANSLRLEAGIAETPGGYVLYPLVGVAANTTLG